LRVRILGCGTSTGVPKIGNEWGLCDPKEPRNYRLRSSILVESAGERMLVDCGPDLRQQLLAAEVSRLDGVIVTHAHGDHCHGIDELRPVAQALDRPVPMHARAEVLDELQDRFAYAFAHSDFYRPIVEAQSKRGRAAVRLVDEAHSSIAKAELGAKLARFDDRPVEVRMREGVSETVLELVQHLSPSMHRHRPVERLRDRP
jgi:phosphoribosyl 1,2-cyclic phosphate phosphodiesterase